MNRISTTLLTCIWLGLGIAWPAYAHNGIDHNNSCFLTVGDIRLRIVGNIAPDPNPARRPHHIKHYCHFFPELGKIVLAVDPMTAVSGNVTASLELSALALWPGSDRSGYAVKRQEAQALNDNFAPLTETIQQRGLYRLTVELRQGPGKTDTQQLIFLAGVPVTKMLIMLAGLLSVLIAYTGIKGWLVKRKNKDASPDEPK